MSIEETDIELLRRELDVIDQQMLVKLAARFDVCVRIAEYKRQHAVPMMQPHRIAIVQNRAAAFAEANGIDKTFIQQFYELVIAETCRVEDAVIASD